MKSLLAALLILCSTAAFSAAPKEDPVALAQLMVRDGHWDRARQVLMTLQDDDKTIDHSRRFATWGLIYLNDQAFSDAAQAFQKAIDHTDDASEPDPLLWVYLAQALVFDKQPTKALHALDKAGTAADHLPQSYDSLPRPSRPQAIRASLANTSTGHKPVPGTLGHSKAARTVFNPRELD